MIRRPTMIGGLRDRGDVLDDRERQPGAGHDR